MNTPLFIARRMGISGKGKDFTGIIKKIAILSIALGIAVMILSMAVVTGFQQEIRGKVIGFGGHIQVTNYDYNISFEARPIRKDQFPVNEALNIPGVRHIQIFATKPGIIRTDDDIHGVILKGIGPDFNWSFFQDKIVAGRILELNDTLRSDEVIISGVIARQLQLEVRDDIIMYFIQEPPRIRRFTVAGIYDTGLEELDKVFMLGDIRHIQRLNDWNSDQIGGFEILADGFDAIPDIEDQVLDLLPFHLDAKSIRVLYPQIFDWLGLLDMNVYVIIILMILVAGINMVTTLLISVLEKTNAIGILKALGGSDTLIRKVFLYHAGILISWGLLWGNIVGILFCLIQGHFGLITLSPESYYVSEVPINLQLSHILLINAGTFLVSMTMLIVPSYIVTKISPVKAIIFR